MAKRKNTAASGAMDPVSRAARAVGNQTELAKMLGVTSQAIDVWRKRGIPIKRMADVERVTGIPRTELFPEVFDGLMPVPPMMGFE